MLNIKNEIEKLIKILYGKKEIILIILCIIFYFFMFKENIYSPYSDIGRELYVTEQVKNGLVLYKDIFNVYSPLSYLINSVLIKFLGNNINTYFSIGLLISILTIIPIFLISKKYTNKILATFITLFIISSCTYFPSISNWITPYSYSITYALCSMLWSFYFLQKGIEENKNNLIYLSAFFTGMSLCFKYEFIGLILIIFAVAIYKKIFIKTTYYLSILPILTIIILLVQGCGITDFSNAIKYILSLSESKSVKFFYDYAGITFSIENMQYAFYNMIYPNLKTIFAPLCYINLILLLFAIKNKEKNLTLLLLTGLITSIKSFGGITFEIYGTYFFPLLFIGLIAFIYKKDNKINNAILLVLCSLLITTYSLYGMSEDKKLAKIQTQKGEMHIPSVFLDSTSKIIKYINENIETNKQVLIMPEGTFINYITDKKSDDYLYYLIPPNNDVFGENFIERKLKSKTIDYILTTNIQYPWYNEKSFMTGWGNKYIENIIEKEYKKEITIGENLKFHIFKHDIIK